MLEALDKADDVVVFSIFTFSSVFMLVISVSLDEEVTALEALEVGDFDLDLSAALSAANFSSSLVFSLPSALLALKRPVSIAAAFFI